MMFVVRARRPSLVVRLKSVLNPRELEVALLAARELSNKELAGELRMSEGTVKIHMHRILRKLGLSNRYSLISFCKANGAAILASALWISGRIDSRQHPT